MRFGSLKNWAEKKLYFTQNLKVSRRDDLRLSKNRLSNGYRTVIHKNSQGTLIFVREKCNNLV